MHYSEEVGVVDIERNWLSSDHWKVKLKSTAGFTNSAEVQNSELAESAFYTRILPNYQQNRLNLAETGPNCKFGPSQICRICKPWSTDTIPSTLMNSRDPDPCFQEVNKDLTYLRSIISFI
jgi:hypothetical protein